MLVKIVSYFSFWWLTINCLKDNSFNHNVDFTADDGGERFKLHSSGVLSEVLDLDVIPGIKRLLCVGDRILLVTNESDVGSDWKVGQILLASSKWRCNGTEDSSATGVYAKIASIYFPTDRRLSIHVVPAGPYDMIEEANIHFRYTPGRNDLPLETKTRHRRFISNVLTKVLGNIDWKANFSTRIPFNEDIDGAPQRHFTIHKTTGVQDLNLTYSINGTDDFTVKCISCHGGTHLSYIFELLIKKVNNKPRLLKHTSQFEANVERHTDMEVEFTQEMGVNYSRQLWETGPIELIRIPVAVLWKLPPVELTLFYNSQTFGHVHGYSRRAVKARTGFTTRGKYTLSQNFAESSNVHGDMTYYDWESHGQDEQEIEVKDTLNITVDIYQKITFNASISWRTKDIFINLSPPMEMTVKPSTKLETTINGHEQCVVCSLSVQGVFTAHKSQLSVEAFGRSIWDVVLNPEISKKTTLIETTISKTCLAHCVGPSELGPPLTDAQVCGEMTDRIVRGTQQFNSLQILYGSELYFSSEETDYDWCGDTGSPCTPCNVTSNTNVTDVCADRYVSARLAPAITKLAQLVKAEWPRGDEKSSSLQIYHEALRDPLIQRHAFVGIFRNDVVFDASMAHGRHNIKLYRASLIVLEAWDEPTSAYPDGQHGNASLHYEGRAAVVTISGDVDNDTISRLGSLSVCSGFEYVKIDKDANVVHVAVKEDGFSNTTMKSEEEMYADMFNDNSLDSKYKKCARIAPNLKVGDTYPPNQSVDEVCGPSQGYLDRVNKQDLNRLYYYEEDDVVFSPEGNSSDVCGHSTRKCMSDCQHFHNMTEPWTWCSTRLMSPRMALKLRQLVKLAKAEDIVIFVERAFTETSVLPLQHQFKEGRGLKLTSKLSKTTQVERLAVLAACSGFDYMHYASSDYIEVFVRNHEGILATRVQFLDEDATRLAVNPPLHMDTEYQYPAQLLEEAISPHLVGGYDSDTLLSEHYKVGDFLCPNRPYFRIDSSLLLCLDLITDEYGRKVQVLSGSAYRTQSVNMINFDIRHPEERYRFQAGQAVELIPPRYRSDSDLVNLAKIILKSCTPFLREQMRGVGIGCHQDRLYLDIRPLEKGKEMKYITVWDAENSSFCGEVVDLQELLLDGGPVVNPFDKIVCSYHPLGKEKFYLTFQFRQKGMCSTSLQSAFCSATLPFRQEESRKLQERMTSAAGYGRLPRADIHREIDQCTVALCGGCSGTGRRWDEKIKACSLMVDRFITRATRAFPDLTNRATFFNTETAQSSVHSLACHDGNICVENIQLYSLLMPLVTSRYRPDPTGSIETMMFSSDRNPTPLLELVEQEMAYRASGRVKVYIEHQTDFKHIRNVIKVLMAFNKNVTEVQFHVSSDLDIDLVAADLQRHLDVWAGNTCPEHSRFAISPFTFHQLSHARRRRSLERSQHRNEARRRVYDWELDWMMKLL